MSKQDYYSVLGVSTEASAQQIKEAYRHKAFEYHPDRNQGSEWAATQMKAINEAYAVLSNTEKRRDYDKLRLQYGNEAYDRFRQTYSDYDIFRNSDFRQVFEEIARSFGLSGFDDIFKDVNGYQSKKFEFRQPGFFAKGFVFRSGPSLNKKALSKGPGILGRFALKLFLQIAGIRPPKQGQDIHDIIELKGDLAKQGGAYKYYLRQRNKKLVVKIPPRVRSGQLIRLSGMGYPGINGAAAGDLYLRVKVRIPLVEKMKTFLSHHS